MNTPHLVANTVAVAVALIALACGAPTVAVVALAAISLPNVVVLGYRARAWAERAVASALTP